MALQTSGQISIGDVRNELGVTGQLALGSSAVRDLFGIASGEIRLSDGYGASLAPQWQTDLTALSYDNISFDFSNQETNATDTAFDFTGTKMYIVGTVSDEVHQYTLSTGFDISTASYDSVSFDVSSEDSNPRGLAFNTDGTKMYMVGLITDAVYQYTLSTGFDLSTASYDSVSFDVSSEDGVPVGLTFNTDGTKMYMVGLLTREVHQYTLSTGFDLSTASYDNILFSFATESTDPRGMEFSFDGTKMYLLSGNDISVYQYTLSIPFDVSTISYDSISTVLVANEEQQAYTLSFNTDGTRIFVSGISSSVNDAVMHQYTAA